MDHCNREDIYVDAWYWSENQSVLVALLLGVAALDNT